MRKTRSVPHEQQHICYVIMSVFRRDENSSKKRKALLKTVILWQELLSSFSHRNSGSSTAEHNRTNIK